jgi:hypothetical protein
MTGGPISDGTYVLTSRVDYTGTCACYHRITLVISGGGTHVEEVYDATRRSAMLSTFGSVMTMTYTCPAGQLPNSETYTATANTIQIWEDSDLHLDVYTRR